MSINKKMPIGSVLVVDDEEIIRHLIAFKFIQAGLDAAVAPGGTEALRLLDMVEFDAVVTDVRMPGLSGLDLLRQVRHRFPLMPVILMSGMLSEDVWEAADRWGAVAVFQKPVNRTRLVGTVQVAIGDSRLRNSCLRHSPTHNAFFGFPTAF